MVQCICSYFAWILTLKARTVTQYIITLDREENIKMPNWQPLFCSFILNMYFLIVKATKTVALSTHEVALSTLTHWIPAVFTFSEWFSTKTIHSISWLFFWNYHGKWCCPKTLKAQGFWKRHSDVAIFQSWSSRTAQVQFVCKFC